MLAFTLWFITAAKLQWWRCSQVNLWLRATTAWGTVWKEGWGSLMRVFPFISAPNKVALSRYRGHADHGFGLQLWQPTGKASGEEWFEFLNLYFHVCRVCQEKYWVRNACKGKDGGSWMPEKTLLFSTVSLACLFWPSEQTRLSRPLQVPCLQTQRGRGRAHLPKTCFLFQLLSRSWKASTLPREPSGLPWKATCISSLTLWPSC